MTKNVEPLGGGMVKPPFKITSPWKIAIIAIVIVILAVVWYFDTFGTQNHVILTPTHIQQTFLDIDADGDIDLIVSAEVIYNEGQENFPQGQ